MSPFVRIWNSLPLRLWRCVAWSTWAALLCATANANAAQPNIVLIISDDHAWTDYGFMQHPHIQTPNLDRLARASLTFTRGYVPTSLCRPSLASIITGLYPHEHGIVGNDPPVANPQNLPAAALRKTEAYYQAREEFLQHIDRAVTLPERLGELGYVSLQTGKWWEGDPRRAGFTAGMTHGDPRRGGRHGDEGLRIGREGLTEIFDFIRQAQAQQQPFFIWYAPMLPHAPHNPPERLLSKYVGKTKSPHVARYWAMCEWFDETCGELVQFIDDQQLGENTVIVYVADNGWISREDAPEFAPKSKRSPYDGGVRTPIMWRWPGHIQPALDQSSLASSLDIVPTLLHITGSAADPSLPGINLLDEMQRTSRHEVSGEIFEHDVVSMTDPQASLMYRWVIHDYWKLIVPEKNRVPGASSELYDLKSDPHERQALRERVEGRE